MGGCATERFFHRDSVFAAALPRPFPAPADLA